MAALPADFSFSASAFSSEDVEAAGCDVELEADVVGCGVVEPLPDIFSYTVKTLSKACEPTASLTAAAFE